jgi:hypothetical protein
MILKKISKHYYPVFRLASVRTGSPHTGQYRGGFLVLQTGSPDGALNILVLFRFVSPQLFYLIRKNTSVLLFAQQRRVTREAWSG